MYSVPVWNADKNEWTTWHCTEKTYNALQKAKEEYKRKYDTAVEPYVITRDNGLPEFGKISD